MALQLLVIAKNMFTYEFSKKELDLTPSSLHEQKTASIFKWKLSHKEFHWAVP